MQDSKELVHQYVDALTARDPVQCAEFFSDDAALHFMMGVYTGKEMIEDWHKERFEAGMKVLKVDKVVERGDQVSCEVLIESDRLKAWRINTLRGKATFRIHAGEINEIRFSLVGGNPLEGWQ